MLICIFNVCKVLFNKLRFCSFCKNTRGKHICSYMEVFKISWNTCSSIYLSLKWKVWIVKIYSKISHNGNMITYLYLYMYIYIYIYIYMYIYMYIRVHRFFKINILASAWVLFYVKFNSKNILFHGKIWLEDVYSRGNR